MLSLENIQLLLKEKHVEAPVTIRKIIDALQNDGAVMHAALNYYHEGKLIEYYYREGS